MVSIFFDVILNIYHIFEDGQIIDVFNDPGGVDRSS